MAQLRHASARADFDWCSAAVKNLAFEALPSAAQSKAAAMRRAGAAATAALLLATATALDASVAGAIDVRWAVAARASVEIRFKMQGTDAQRSR